MSCLQSLTSLNVLDLQDNQVPLLHCVCVCVCESGWDRGRMRFRDEKEREGSVLFSGEVVTPGDPDFSAAAVDSVLHHLHAVASSS